MFNGCFTGAVSGCEFSISEIHGRRPGSLCAETGSHTSPASFASLTLWRGRLNQCCLLRVLTLVCGGASFARRSFLRCEVSLLTLQDGDRYRTDARTLSG